MHDLDLGHRDDDEDVAQDDEDAEGDKVHDLGHCRHTASLGQTAGAAVTTIGAADVGKLDIGSFGSDQFHSLHGDWNWLVLCQGPAIDFCHTYSLGMCWISLLLVEHSCHFQFCDCVIDQAVFFVQFFWREWCMCLVHFKNLAQFPLSLMNE